MGSGYLNAEDAKVSQRKYKKSRFMVFFFASFAKTFAPSAFNAPVLDQVRLSTVCPTNACPVKWPLAPLFKGFDG